MKFKDLKGIVSNGATSLNENKLDINMSDEYNKMFTKIVNSIVKKVKSVKGVESSRLVDKARSDYKMFIINVKGYTKSDFEAESTIVLEFRYTDDHYVRIDSKRPDWGKFEHNQMDENFKEVIPVGKILNYVNQTFGV